MKSTDNLSGKGRLIWSVIRHFVPRRMRFFYEGRPGLRGQLWYAERKLLYDTVRAVRPAHCFEIGTWRGGGSTFFISSALAENGQGVLHTVEIDREFYDDAVSHYNTLLPQLAEHVKFHFGDYRSEYRPVLQESGKVDFLILDGAEDARQTLEQFNFFLPYMSSGSVLLVHDWFTEKTKLVKPMLERANEWEIRQVLGPPVSVGLAVIVRK